MSTTAIFTRQNKRDCAFLSNFAVRREAVAQVRVAFEVGERRVGCALSQRRPLFETQLFREAGLAPPPFLAPDPSE